MRIYFLLLIFVLYFCQNLKTEENLNKKEFKDQLEIAADLEYKLLCFRNSELENDNLNYLQLCEDSYTKILNSLIGLNENEVDTNRKLYSRVYDRCAWYFFQNSKKYNELELSCFFLKAINLDKKNYIAYYKAAIFFQDKQVKLYREYLLRAYELNNDFVEVNYELAFNFYNENRDPELFKKLKAGFLEKGSKYLPELYYFDNGYLPANHHIYIDNDKGVTVEVERKIYYDKNDKKRFALKELE